VHIHAPSTCYLGEVLSAQTIAEDIIFAIPERGGSARTFHLDKATKVAVASIVSENIGHETPLYTDESALYPEVGNGEPRPNQRTREEFISTAKDIGCNED
jgi:hypothetical protein